MAGLVLDGISKKFGGTQVLDDIDLAIEDGEFLVLLGPSGCGKTTLLRVIAGLIDADAGRVIVGDRDVSDLAPRDRDLAMVFQSYALYPHLTVERNLGFGLRMQHRSKDEIKARVAEVADLLKLGSLLARRPKELSGGQRQRVALGRAIVRDPKAFLMDEPLSNLDAQLRTATRLELSELHRRLGTTFVYVTHDQIEAMTMATRIAIFDDGRLEQLGAPTEVYDEPATTFVARFIGSPAMNLTEVTASTREGFIHLGGEGIDVTMFEGTAPERRVTLGVRPEHLQRARADEPQNFQGTVVALENLGNEEIAFVEIANSRFAWRGARPLGVHIGEHVRLSAEPHRISLFDVATSRRLIWVRDGDPRPIRLSSGGAAPVLNAAAISRSKA